MATSAQIAQQLANYDSKRKSSADYVNEAMLQHGVPEIRSRVSGLRTTLANTENALNSVDPSVTGRTSRSLVTEAQRSRIVNKEREPIAAQYGDQSRALSNESANMSEQMKAAQLLAEGQISDYTIGRSALQSRYSDTVASETEQRRRQESDRAFSFQQQQAEKDYRLRLQIANKPSGGGGGGGKTPAAPEYIGKDDFRGALAYQAKNGNNDAKVALKYAGNDAKAGGKIASKADFDALKRLGIGGNYWY